MVSPKARVALLGLLLAVPGSLAMAGVPPEPLPDPLADDPARPGPFQVGSGEYLLGHTLSAQEPPAPAPHSAPHSLRGVAYYPLDAPGRRPVLLFVHGNHLPVVDSHHGYAYLGTHLASHGHVVLSLDANEVNARSNVAATGELGRDPAVRAALLLATLDRLRAPDPLQPVLLPPGFPDRLDLARVGLMGHSRGGLAVQMAAAANAALPDPFGIRAVLAIAPTGAAAVDGDVAVAAMAGTCDGDTGPGGAVATFDGMGGGSRHLGDGPRHLLVASGANHNHYNSRWAEDDWLASLRPDAPTDPACSPLVAGSERLSPEDQRRHARTFAAAFFQVHVAGKRTHLGWLTDAAVAPATACPAALGACDALLHLSHRPAAADRLLLEDGASAATGPNDLGGASALAGFTFAGSCLAPASPCGGLGRFESGLDALALSWNGTATWRLEVPASRRGDVAAFGNLSLRAAVNDESPAGMPQDFRIVLEDRQGNRASVRAALFTSSLGYPVGTASQASILHGLRVPVAAFAGVDPADLAAVELAFGPAPAGSLQVADLWFVR